MDSVLFSCRRFDSGKKGRDSADARHSNIVEYTYEVVQYVSCLCTIYMKAGLSSHVFLLQYEVIIIEL
jgi:hypothetical protein